MLESLKDETKEIGEGSLILRVFHLLVAMEYYSMVSEQECRLVPPIT